MRHVVNWTLLLLAWSTGVLAILIWPELGEQELLLLDDITTAFYFRPFHYLSSSLFLLFFFMIALRLWRRITYEWLLFRLIRHRPIHMMVIALLLIGIQWRLVAYFGLPLLGLMLAVGLYVLLHQAVRRKTEMVVPKK